MIQNQLYRQRLEKIYKKNYNEIKYDLTSVNSQFLDISYVKALALLVLVSVHNEGKSLCHGKYLFLCLVWNTKSCVHGGISFLFQPTFTLICRM